MPLELTDQQRQALEQQPAPGPIEVVDPVSHRAYVLLAREQYEQMRSLLGCTDEQGKDVSKTQDIALGIRRSQQAYRRDLPALLAWKEWIGQWVCYHGDERIGIAPTMAVLMRECLNRGWNDSEFIIARIEPAGLIDEEELGPPDSQLVEDEDVQP
jgi:hypothetical protein